MNGSGRQLRRRLAFLSLAVTAGWFPVSWEGPAGAAEVKSPYTGVQAAPLSRQAPVFTYRELTSRFPPLPNSDDADPVETSALSLPEKPSSGISGPSTDEDQDQEGIMGRFGRAVAAEPARAGLSAVHLGQGAALQDAPTPTAIRAGEPVEPEASAAKPPEAAPHPAQAKLIGSGRASWYQHSGKTANGDTYDPNQLTAAHHTLPFGTKVKVVNKQNGRSVVVEITDRTNERTKKKRDYAIDLSRASAQKLGIKGIGLVALYTVN